MGTLLFRLDDITAEQNWENFERLHDIFGTYGIAPVIGVVPDNRDVTLRIGKPRADYVSYMKRLQGEGWVIAQHGFQHTYVNRNGGMLKVNRQSEFAGLSFEEQRKKLQAGQEILQNMDIHATMFMAPAHTYDRNTLKALKSLGFRWMTDGYTDSPYQMEGLTFIPCTVSKPVIPKADSVVTVCYHPNMMTEEKFEELEQFLGKYASSEHVNLCQGFGSYLESISENPVRRWGVCTAWEQRKNLTMRKLKLFAASNALCQAYFRHRHSG